MDKSIMETVDIIIPVTSPSFSKNSTLRDEVIQYFPQAQFNLHGVRMQGKELAEYIGNAEVAIVGTEKVTEEVLSLCPNLKHIAKYGVGTDNIDFDVCEKHGVTIGWTGGVNKRSVAEMALSFMIGLCRNLYFTSHQLKQGTWNKNGGFQLTGKTVGIIGLGHVGKEVCRLLQPFDCKILVNDIIDIQDYANQHGLHVVTKEELYQQANIVSVHVPLKEDTRSLISEQQLNSMKPTAFVINTARGGIIHQKDLGKALQNNVIAGAALDVYDEEPITDIGFLSLPNLVCTPHIGGNAEEAVLAMGRSAFSHVKTYYGINE
jgi:D-3-phosphoglycerate dehydrogenase